MKIIRRSLEGEAVGIALVFEALGEEPAVLYDTRKALQRTLLSVMREHSQSFRNSRRAILRTFFTCSFFSATSFDNARNLLSARFPKAAARATSGPCRIS